MNYRIIWVIFERYIPVKILLFIYLAGSAVMIFMNKQESLYTGFYKAFLHANYIYSFANFCFLVIVPAIFYGFIKFLLENIFRVKRTAVSQDGTRIILALLLLSYSVVFAAGHIFYWHTKNQVAEADSELTVLTVVALLNYIEIFYFGLNRMRAQWVFRHIVLNSIVGMVMALLGLFLGAIKEQPSPVSLGLAGVFLFTVRLWFLVYDQKNQVTSVLTGDTEPLE